MEFTLRLQFNPIEAKPTSSELAITMLSSAFPSLTQGVVPDSLHLPELERLVWQIVSDWFQRHKGICLDAGFICQKSVAKTFDNLSTTYGVPDARLPLQLAAYAGWRERFLQLQGNLSLCKHYGDTRYYCPVEHGGDLFDCCPKDGCPKVWTRAYEYCSAPTGDVIAFDTISQSTAFPEDPPAFDKLWRKLRKDYLHPQGSLSYARVGKFSRKLLAARISPKELDLAKGLFGFSELAFRLVMAKPAGKERGSAIDLLDWLAVIGHAMILNAARKHAA